VYNPGHDDNESVALNKESVTELWPIDMNILILLLIMTVYAMLQRASN